MGQMSVVIRLDNYSVSKQVFVLIVLYDNWFGHVVY